MTAVESLYLGERWFAQLHRPSTATGIGLVIVPPFGFEAVCAHRALRVLAERAAAAGVIAVRIDVDGTGDSAGDDLDPDRVGQWCASIAAAADLARSSGATRLVLAGVRLGAALAARVAAARDDVAGVVAIAPVISGKRWLREMRALQLALGLAPPPAGAADEPQEVIGFAVTAETRAAVTAIDLERAPVAPAPAVLVLDRHDLPASTKWIARLRELGADVDARQLPGYVEMMLDPHKVEIPEQLIAATIEFTLARPRRDARAITTATARVARLGAVIEEPIAIGSLAAITTRPATDARPRRALILLNAGCVRRIGPNRLHVAMARRFAAEGALVVRVDLSGIGDSPPHAGVADRVVYHEHSLVDVAAILAWCRSAGVEHAIASGLCSGGYYALRSVVAGDAWDGIIALNPGTPGTGIDDAPYAAIEHTERYGRRLFELDAWKKVMRGGVDLRHVARNVINRATELAASRTKDLARRVGVPLDGDLGSELQRLARRHVAMTFVFCDRDPGLVLFRERAGGVAPRLEAQGALSVRVIAGPDHTFTPRWSHAALIEEIAGALNRSWR